MKMMLYFLKSFFFLIPWCVSRVFASCPALAINFKSYGVPECAPSFTLTNPDQVDEILSFGKCIAWSTWTVPRSLGCNPPNLPVGAELEFPCDCSFGGKCNVVCSRNYKLVGNQMIECKRGGRWTQMPSCVQASQARACRSYQIPQNLVKEGHCDYAPGTKCKVRCANVAMNIPYMPPYIECTAEATWKRFPVCLLFCDLNKIPEYLSVVGTCNGKSVEICSVTCKDNRYTQYSNTITCINGQWVHSTICGCSKESFPANAIYNEYCATVSFGKTCTVTCQPDYYQIGSSTILCGLDGKFIDTSVSCNKMCPELDIPSVRIMPSNCRVRQGQECSVACKESEWKLLGPNTIKCLLSGEYSQMPACAPAGYCPKDALPKYLFFTGECSAADGQSCYVACKDSTFTLRGSQSINCQSSGWWSEFPKCEKRCGEIHLSSDLVVFTDKTKSCNDEVGETCEIQCVPGMYPIEPKAIKCLPSGQWESLPVCRKMCPPLDNLPDMVVSLAICDRTIGTKCNLKCREPFFLLKPVLYVTCLETSSWSDFPKCKRQCLMPTLPSGIEFKGNCSLMEDDLCFLKCSLPTVTIIGDAVGSCTASGVFEYDSSITCGTKCTMPTLPQELKFSGNCDSTLPRSSCTVACKNPLATVIGSDEVKCLGNDQWSSFPKCKIICSEPILQPGIHIAGPCRYEENSECVIACNSNNMSMDNGQSEGKIKCVNGAWTKHTECTIHCKDPVFPPYLAFKGICIKKVLQTCPVYCTERGLELSDVYSIQCRRSLKWSHFPTCNAKCNMPDFPPGVSFVSTCSAVVNDFCEVQCEAPGVPDEKFISCLPTLNWSRYPRCVEKCPEIGKPYFFTGVCNRETGETCSLGCIHDPTIKTIAYCDNSLWVIGTTNCALKECVLPAGVMKNPNYECSLFPDEKCTVQCISAMSILTGSPVITFGKHCEILETPVPRCTDITDAAPTGQCPSPQLAGTSIELQGSCDPPFTVNKFCSIDCNPDYGRYGNDFIMCREDFTWTKLPICSKKCYVTSDLQGLKIIDYPGYCDMTNNEYCAVKCDQGYLQDNATALCKDGRWIVPKCGPEKGEACGEIPSFLREMRRFGQAILVKCRLGPDKVPYILTGPDAIVCLPNDEWSTLPTCIVQPQ